MLEIVQEILDAERKAEETVEKAKAEADKIRVETDGKANKIIQDARNEAQRSSLEQIDQTRRRSSTETEKALEQERKKIDVFEQDHAAEIDSLVSEIVDLIIQTGSSG